MRKFKAKKTNYFGGPRKKTTGNPGQFSNSRGRVRKSGNVGQRKKAGRGKRENIDVSKFIRHAKPNQPIEVAKIQNTFADFGFCNEINKNLNEIGYVSPTPIQDKSIKPIMEGRDLTGIANTGTGKTAAFLLPLINKCFKDKNQRVLIIAPTRELAQQIDQEFRKFSKNMNLYSATCVGGLPIHRQISMLKRRPSFVIGTPGRLKDLKDRKTVNFSYFQNIVLDEIDRMLDMGFVDEIKQILSDLPQNRHSLFFSATLPLKIESLVKQFSNDPIIVRTKTGETAANVEQDVIKVNEKEKFNKLREILVRSELNKVLIFSETKRGVDKLSKNLAANGFRADCIHGDKRQNQRQKALSRFKENNVQILVATDVAARGLDIDNVSHVINYTIPNSYDDYVHRIGRTGRGDKSGVALTFVE